MQLWKKILLASCGFGIGLSITLGLIAGIWFWYSNRPKPPKPWNKKAITADYDYVRPQGDANDLSFSYILQNNTDADYRLESATGIDITGKLKDEKEFSQFSDRYVTTEYPIFIPARSRVRCSLNIPYPYTEKEKQNPTPDERRQYTTRVAKYVTEEMGNLEGFVLFDNKNRYEIDFPGGWEERSKEISAQK